MTFYNIGFILYFLTPFIIIYYLVPSGAKNAVLLAASILFGLLAGPMYFLVILGSIAVNYLLGILIGKHRTAPLLAIGAAANTILPIIFRLNMKPEMLGTLSPVIILFFGMCMCSFRALTYLIDLYKGTTAIQRNILKFMNYMLYFPAFTAGPLIRYNDFRLQLRERDHSGTDFIKGTAYFICGILKKTVFADRLAALWHTILNSDLSVLTAANAYLGIAALVLCILISVSAYWDCAVGLCRITGFDVSRSFRPIRYIREIGAAAAAYLFPLAASAWALVSLFDIPTAETLFNATLKGNGFNEVPFLYHFCSNRILLLVSAVIALRIPALLGRLITKPFKHERKKDSTAARIASLAVMAGLLVFSTANAVLMDYPEKTFYTENRDDAALRIADKSSSQSFIFSEQLDMLNADAGFLMKVSGKNGVYYAEGNTLIERPADYNERSVDAAIETIDAVSDKERYTTHIALIPPAYEIHADTLPPYAHDNRVKKTVNRVYELLDGSAIELFDASALLKDNSGKKLYYSTSPELTAEGTYIVYKALTQQLGCKDYGYDTFGFKEGSYGYKGDLWHKAGTHFTAADRYSEPLKAEERIDGNVSVLSSDAKSGRALVLITDGTAPDIDRLFSKSFDTVYVFRADADKERMRETVSKYLSDKFVTDMLVVCGTDFML